MTGSPECMHVRGSGFYCFSFFLLHVHLFSIQLVVVGAWAWTIVGWSLYFFSLFLSCSTNGARGDIFFCICGCV